MRKAKSFIDQNEEQDNTNDFRSSVVCAEKCVLVLLLQKTAGCRHKTCSFKRVHGLCAVAIEYLEKSKIWHNCFVRCNLIFLINFSFTFSPFTDHKVFLHSFFEKKLIKWDKFLFSEWLFGKTKMMECRYGLIPLLSQFVLFFLLTVSCCWYNVEHLIGKHNYHLSTIPWESVKKLFVKMLDLVSYPGR